MASSDDEGGTLPSEVSDYYFEDNNDELISFAELPLKWDDAETESLEGNQKEIGLRGKADNGLQTIFEQATAWKFDISYEKPEIMVLTRKKNWIKLQKPRKSYEDTIRKILITVHCLIFVKRNRETSVKALWDQLAKHFSLYDIRPSEDDLMTNLISEAVKRDEVLARSEVLGAFLEDKPKKKVFEEAGTTAKSSFIVDDVPDENDGNEEDCSDDEDEDFFEHVCAICDNGGDILCCEGKCLRSFHATEDAGSESNCESLGFSNEQVKAMANQIFECKNCQYKQHQCFVCGELGSSDKSAGAKVFQCVNGTCGYFYHPHCVAKALQFKRGDKAKDLEGDLEGEIAAGKAFVCPIHTCFVCKEPEPEDKNDLQLQFAVCRRCPRAYHRKCLPRKISFEKDEDQGIEQRAWEDLMPNKILIYCLKHEIEEEIETPIRNHIKFPDAEGKKGKQTSDSVGRGKVLQKKGDHASKVAALKNVSRKSKMVQKSSSGVKQIDLGKTNEGRLSIPESSRKWKLADYSKTASKRNPPRKYDKSIGGDREASLGEQLYEQYFDEGSVLAKVVGGEASDKKEQLKAGRPVSKEANESVKLDADSEKRILSFVRQAESTISLEDVIKEHNAPSTHVFSSKYVMQNITLGKVEGSIEALNAALQKLEEGGSLEDAKAVCEPGLLNQIPKWQNKLKVYLAPFIHGMRYTSFGRHFTKVEKLQAIVNKLHSYVADGDTIVDFCCGANDFSCLMKRKMDEMGKSCSYRNYDIKPAKNDFNFEKKDWMTVQKSDLPSGSELIMGLNPPFGVNAALANKFIDKALEFKPKLLILIVPRETVRLDIKRYPYDLVWEDDKLLSGKAFYLPGSIDVNGKQMEDWNVNAPPLYLWSRPDWTKRHKEIAQQQGHLPSVGRMVQLEEKRNIPDYPQELHDLCCNSTVTDSHMEGFCNDKGDQESPKDLGHKDHAKVNCEDGNKNKSKDHPKDLDHKDHAKVNCEDGNKNKSKDHAKVNCEGGNKNKRRRGRASGEKSSPQRKSLPHHSSPTGRSKLWDRSEHSETQSQTHVWREGYQHFEHTSVSGLQVHTERGFDSYQDDGIARRNRLSTAEAFLDMGNRWQHPVGPGSDYGFSAPDVQFVNYQRDHTSVVGHGAQFSEGYEPYRREADIRVQARFYGLEDPNSMSHISHYRASPASGFSSSYRQLGPGSEHNSTITSAMQRYAPRLDELNPRMNGIGSVGQFDDRSGFFNAASRPGPGAGPMGFAPGPYRPYSQQSSSGWLNE